MNRLPAGLPGGKLSYRITLQEEGMLFINLSNDFEIFPCAKDMEKVQLSLWLELWKSIKNEFAEVEPFWNMQVVLKLSLWETRMLVLKFEIHFFLRHNEIKEQSRYLKDGSSCETSRSNSKIKGNLSFLLFL